MTIVTNSQPPFVVNTAAEMGTLLTLYPSIPEMTQCYVRDDNDVFRLDGGVWVQTYPDAQTMTWLQNLDTDMTTVAGQINALQSAMTNKADSSTVTALSGSIATSLAAINTALGGKQNTITPSAATADAANNAATNAPTNLNVVTTLLGSLTGEVNATNAKQNDLATKYNDLAGKFNTLMAQLRAQGLKSA